MLVLPLLASAQDLNPAYDVAAENEDHVTIYYNYINDGKQLEVTYRDTEYNSYTGVVNIPPKAIIDDRVIEVVGITENAFKNCTGLTQVTIPDLVTRIGEAAFDGCTNLTTATIGESVVTIGKQAFYGCSKLTAVSIPNQVTSIGDSAFDGCSSLATATIGNSVESIGYSSFKGCTSLTAVTLPNSVTTIHSEAFYGCSKLTAVNIPNSVTDLGAQVFRQCYSLTTITIPESVAQIEDGTFAYCTSLTSVTIGKSVTNIGNEAFAACSKLTSVTIPNGVTSIGRLAFRGCSSLTAVTLPNSVNSIDKDAFRGCSKLTAVLAKMNEACYLPEDCFPEVANKATLYVSKGTKGQYQSAEYWKNFSNIVEASDRFGEDSETFAAVNADGVTIFYYPYNEWNEDPQNEYMKLAVTSIDNSIEGEKGSYAGRVNIPEEVTYNGKNLPVTKIACDAFVHCTDLTSVTIPNSVKSIISHAFYGCTGLTSVIIGDSVNTIEGDAFSGCTSLTSVTIPDSVKTIQGHAFMDCANLASVTIGKSVTKLESGVFYNCPNLVSVVSRMEVPCEIDEQFFDDEVFQNATLYVPKGTTEKYQTTNYWRKFNFDENVIESEICATPTIGYGNKELTFSCETEGVEYHYTITVSDQKADVGNKVSLDATYEISVYATKTGWLDSEVATATLVWTNAVFTGAEPIVTQAKAATATESIPVLISARDGNLTVKSELEGQPVAVYSIDGKALGSAKVSGGQAVISTNQTKGKIVIVKVGNRSVKVII